MSVLESKKATELIPEELRCEVNLLLYPFFALRNNDVLERNEIEFCKTIKRGDDKIEIMWNVSANPKYGFPGPFDKKIHRAFEQVIEEGGIPATNPIQFTIYGLCQRLGISPGGSNYRKVKEALERLITTSIKSQGTFYQKGKKKWIDKTFHLYDSVIYKGEELDNRVPRRFVRKYTLRVLIPY